MQTFFRQKYLIYVLEEWARLKLDTRYHSQNIAILSNNQAAKSHVMSSMLFWERRDQLNKMDTAKRVSLHWVPGQI